MARLVTSLGTMVAGLEEKKAPQTVANLWAWRRVRKPMTTQEVTPRGRRTTTARSFIG